MLTKFRDLVSGQYQAKGAEYRVLRSIRLTDSTWSELENVATDRSMTRGDLIESMASDGYLRAYNSPVDSGSPQAGDLRSRLEAIVSDLLTDPQLTRNGKDRGTVKKALQALLDRL